MLGFGDNLVLEKIDRAWCNLEWMNEFDHSFLEVFPSAASDHSPLILHTEKPIRGQYKHFKFEAMWLIPEDCGRIISNAWNTSNSHQGSSAFRLINKIEVTTRALHQWDNVK